MSKMMRAFAAAAAGATLAAGGAAGASAATSPAAGTARPAAGRVVSAAAASPGEQLWTARYDHSGFDNATSVAASPDGTKVFVTGTSESQFDGYPQFTTVAYNATTGAQLWVRRDSAAIGIDLAVSPDGTKVFVTGRTQLNDHPRFATVAYNAATGAQLWGRRYGSDIGLLGTAPGSLALSPDGTRVVVTGFTSGVNGISTADYATVAYNAATGAQLWARTYNGPGNGRDQAASIATSSGGWVFVTGVSYGGASPRDDYATIAYRGASGTRVWVARYNGPSSRADNASSVAVSPDGTRVVVTGYSNSTATSDDYATVAYRTATGARLWASRYNGYGSSYDRAVAVAISPSGRVFVTGSSSNDYATVAYRAGTGAQLWASRYNGPASGSDNPSSIAVSPGGETVYVTGTSSGGTATYLDYATLAYSTTTGAQAWLARYNGPGTTEAPGPSQDTASSVTVNRAGTQVFVTGSSTGIAGSERPDYLTIAYHS